MSTYRMDIVCAMYDMMDSNIIMLEILLMTSVLAVSSQSNFQSQLWVTKMLSHALDEYTPDGRIVCQRHGLEYRKGLRDLKLWATQSEFSISFVLIVICIQCSLYD